LLILKLILDKNKISMCAPLISCSNILKIVILFELFDLHLMEMPVPLNWNLFLYTLVSNVNLDLLLHISKFSETTLLNVLLMEV